MRSRCVCKAILAMALCSVLLNAAPAEEPPVKLPPALAELLSAAQDDLTNGRPARAIRRLTGFSGKDHALRQLLLGHAHARQGDLPQAAGAYRRALAMDGRMKQAGIALGQVYARQENWPEAAELLGRYLTVDSCGADALLLYARVARRLDDGRLCRLLASKGVVRFPRDLRFRRLDLAVLIDNGDYANAVPAARRLLKEDPGDPHLWQQLAYAAGRQARDLDRLEALEAGLLCQPTNLDRHRQYLTAMLVAGDWLTVIRRGRSLLTGPLATRAAADAGVMELLIQAADVGEQDTLLDAWLKRVDEKARTRPMRLADARSALRQGKTGRARQAIGRLIASGETDPGVFLWAGHLAEQAKDWAGAETYYGQARRSTGRCSELATLYLARSWFFRNRHEQAARLLREHLNLKPEDAPARALLALIQATKPTQSDAGDPQ